MGSSDTDKWSTENHAKWKLAANKELVMLFSVLKRRKIEWDNEGDQHFVILDTAIVARLKAMRERHRCPESLTYLGWAVEQFKKARESQAGLDGAPGKVGRDVEIVYWRIMEDMTIKMMFEAAKEHRSEYPHCTQKMSSIVEMEQRLGIEEGHSFQKRAVACYKELRDRKLMK